MNTFLKENWFKLAILVVVIIIGFSFAYYYLYSLPKRNIEEKAARNIESQVMCSKHAQGFFNYFVTDPIKNQTDEFSNHYNTRLNKCFVLITHYLGNADGMYTRDLYDAVEKRAYGSYAWHPDKVKKYWEVKPIICSMLDKQCDSQEEFDEFVKQYMEY